jgi:hypothetical protein
VVTVIVLILIGGVAGVAGVAVARQSGHHPTSLAGATRAVATGKSAPSSSAGLSAPVTRAKIAGPMAATTSTTVAPVAPVAPAGARHEPSALVTVSQPVTAAQLAAVRALKGVETVDVVDVGTVSLLGAPANTVGVDPGTFRNYTPKVTADTDALWQYIASGTMASSFEMSRDRRLTLGVKVPVAAANSATPTTQWLGAFMSIGLPGVDVVVSRSLSGQLGLVPNAGLVVSAPAADAFQLQNALKATVPTASVVLMRPGLALGSAAGAGAGLTRAQLSTALTAAVSRVGKAYVWGGTGPDGFDCSGLVGWSFAAAGVHLPRTAAEQAQAGPAVPLSQIQPGDLLFWSYDPADPAFIDHVAIYLGNGQMIEAPQTGFSVHVLAVQRGHLVGAVRINPAAAARLGSPWGG